jgi:hypothetical protein
MTAGLPSATVPPDLDSQGRDRNDYAHCAMCGVSELDKEVSLQPSRSQLVFGGFRVKMEHRCVDCEAKVVEGIEAMLKKEFDVRPKAKTRLRS